LANHQQNGHLVEQAFLVHVRSLAEFFREGVDKFGQGPSPAQRNNDNIRAVDFCDEVRWCKKPFGKDTKLIRAINKTLSHMTYSRRLETEIDVVFDGHFHVHGTVKLISRTWRAFLDSVSPKFLNPLCQEDIHFWLDKHTLEWPIRFSELENEFEQWNQRWARECPEYWLLNQTPDGPA
jgi:hypothetical protein